jgi:3-phenylpropionate/trans-cinnamate dioxygenase ferredoxin reductase subunit
MSSTDAIVIIGGGQCGARAAHALRESGWDGAITLVGSENQLPYERPPLSKAVLLGQRLADQCTIYDTAFYRDQGVDSRAVLDTFWTPDAYASIRWWLHPPATFPTGTEWAI